VPLISGTYLQYKNFGLIVAMTIALYFSYEVLIGELRGQLNRLALLTGMSLLVVAIRGVV
jgi:inner membrane protein involved in colicin E2 resistance